MNFAKRCVLQLMLDFLPAVFAAAVCASFGLLPAMLWAQNNPPPVPEVAAERITSAIKIDGVLSEPIWQRPGIFNFTQRDPNEGAPATFKTEAWVAYDDEALYVAARLYDNAPDSIVRRLGRRDDDTDSDLFRVSLDPYHDHLTGFTFAIDPAGSIQDAVLYNDSWSDESWDGVWEGAARLDAQGWAAEMRIPYSQLRFPKREQHVWGINFMRLVQRRNEVSYFVMVPKKESGNVSRFAHLVGIANIDPPRRLEILPYTVARSEFTPAIPGDPFHDGSRLFPGVGADLKLGLGSNLTVDATINPDFGQVEVDPAVINLSAFETFYDEKRPFFIEGSNIFEFGRGGATSYWSFNWGNPDFFYSRRVGRSPQGPTTHSGFVDRPTATTILGAAKLSGKIANNWSLGMINVLTSREYATVDVSGARFKDEVEPLAYYGVLRAKREFRDGRQGLGMIATGVARDLRTPDLENLLSRGAYTAGLDGWTFLDKKKAWIVTGWAGSSLVEGNANVIRRLQEAPARYYQRPDASHVEVDPNATSLSGWATRVMLNKQQGNVFVNAAFGVISPGFDTNDAGFHWRSDVINSHFVIGYRWFKPGKVFRNKNLNVAAFRNYNFGGDKTGDGYFVFANAQFLNYWGFSASVSFSPETFSPSETRGGPLMLNPQGYFANFSVYSDWRKPFTLSLFSGSGAAAAGYSSWNAGVELGIKPNSQLRLTLGPSVDKSHDPAQWVIRQNDPLAGSTYGARYIFSHIDQTTVEVSTRLNWTFTPKLTLQVYLQPFFATGHYSNFKELARPKSFAFNEYGKNGSSVEKIDNGYQVDPDGAGPAESFTIFNPDFNFKSLRGNAVLRWEYLPGSTLYLVWTQERTDFADPGDFRFRRDLRHLLRAEADNVFLAKISYWWNP